MTKKAGKLRPKIRKQPPAFCTTCGDALEDYCFSASAKDVKTVIKNLAVCKAKGRFQGKYCAKLFIAGADGTYQKSKKGRVPIRRIEDLRHAIFEVISKEESKK